MKRQSKFIALLLVLSMLLPGMAQVAKAAEENANENVIRISGKGRVETSIEASKRAYDKADSVVLAGYDGEVDALTGTLLANAKNAPLLLTNKEALPNLVKEEIDRLGATTVYILGGEAVVSKKVAEDLEGYTVKRISGSNREATAHEVAKEVKGTTTHVFLAKGYDGLSDALAIGPVSGLEDMPVLLTHKDYVPKTTLDAMKELGVTHVTIVGGTAAVSEAAAAQLKGYTVNRVKGTDREGTAIEIAKLYLPDAENMIVANGWVSADALVGGYLGAKMNAPILLSNVNSATPKTLEYLGSSAKKVYVLGGKAAISESVYEKIENELEITLEVISVSAITETEVEVKFNMAAPEDNEEMAVVVKDGAGKVVATKTTVVFEGDKEATFDFVTEVATSKLVGIWTVDGVEYNFDDMILFDKIMAELDGNPYIFQELLDEAGITHAQGTKAGLEAYMELLDSLPLDEGTAEILGLDDEFKLETLADIQTLISAIDKVVADSAVDVAKVLAVAKAKTPNQLLAALKANYKMVNSEWKDAYASVLLGSYTDDLIKNLEADPINPQHAVEAILISEEIQEEIYDINYYQIDGVEIDADSAADFAAVITLINTWLPADAEGETEIADWIQELKVAVAEFKVAEATTPNNLYNALVNYANVAADEDDEDVLLLSELNDKLKAFYYEVFEGLDLTKGGDHPYYDTYVKYSIVEPADDAAREAAMLAIETAYEAINAAENEEEDSTTAAQKTALKTALQKLAEYTSHLKGDDKFDMSIVIDANLVAYAEEFAEADAIGETSDVIDVINKVNVVNDEVEEAILFKALNDATTAVQVNAALLGLENETYINIPSADRLFVAAKLLAANEDGDIEAATLKTALDAAILIRTNAIAGVNNLTPASVTTGVVEVLEAIDAAYAKKGLVEKSAIAETFFNGLVFEEGALKTPFTTIAAIKTAAGL